MPNKFWEILVPWTMYIIITAFIIGVLVNFGIFTYSHYLEVIQ